MGTVLLDYMYVQCNLLNPHLRVGSCVDEDVPNAVASTGVFDCERAQLIHVNSADGSLKFTSAGADQEKLLKVCKATTVTWLLFQQF